MDRGRALQLLIAGEKMLAIGDGAASAWKAVSAGKTFSKMARETAIGAESVYSGSSRAVVTILTTCMGVLCAPLFVGHLIKKG